MHWFNSAVPEEKKSANLAGLGKKLFGFYEIISIILIILSLIGIGITDYSPASSHIYWLVMVPVFAAACLIIEWEHVRGKGQQWLSILRTQIMLWVGLLLAVQMVYLLLHAGRLDYENTGLIILLLLALTTLCCRCQFRLAPHGRGDLSGPGRRWGGIPGNVFLDFFSHRHCGGRHLSPSETLCR